jgi:hypothetical protein
MRWRRRSWESTADPDPALAAAGAGRAGMSIASQVGLDAQAS